VLEHVAGYGEMVYPSIGGGLFELLRQASVETVTASFIGGQLRAALRTPIQTRYSLLSRKALSGSLIVIVSRHDLSRFWCIILLQMKRPEKKNDAN
jgi:hypothetical protein